MKTKLLVSMIACAALGLSGCGGNDDNSGGGGSAGSGGGGSAGAGGGGGTMAPTIVDIAAADPQFSTLVAAVQKAGLADTLKGTGPFTVFAPTNDAFAALKSAGVDATQLDLATLTAVLQYHVASGKLLAADLTAAKSATTLGGTVKVDVRGMGLYLNGLTLVTKADIVASNGVIHVIDSVLLPDTSVLDLVGIAVAYPTLSSLKGAVVQAQLAGALQAAGPFTVFAPVNSAFAALPSAPSPSQLPSILQYHVVPGAVMSSAAIDVAKMAPPNNQVATLLSGKKVTLTLAGSTLKVDMASVLYTDIRAKNGVAHLIDSVLLPQ